ncbi:hypothetical protein BaRGS_00022225 [Batillaria attramentaria]|uniref:Chitin-binding type-2 domain-containing protein n=1 Tax=Batillaria attramentaria TaxID=370345 RepID=A0ABD0KHB9_9CAEN
MALKWMAVLLVATVVEAGGVPGNFVPTCESPFALFRHPTDCTIFYQCSWGKPHELQCPQSTVFSLRLPGCVWENSDHDDCSSNYGIETTTATTLSVEERCRQDPTAVIPHPTECHQFYNCSLVQRGFSYYFQDKYQDECPYPQLFDAQKLQCEDYDKVQCGQRREPVNGCDYTLNTCPVSTASHAGCGIRAVRVCLMARTCTRAGSGRHITPCAKTSVLLTVARAKRTQHSFFSPESNKCVSLYEVPREHGGYLLNCTGREDGAHPDDGTQRPNLYFTCQGGQRTGIQLCPDGQIYGDLTTPCVEPGRCSQDPTAVIPHPTECHQFYNCSLVREFSYYFQDKHQDECPYPQLFDAQKLQCEDYRKVQCGQRTERVNGCDYTLNQCLRSHCIPCYVRFPSCEGLPDGPNVDEIRKWTPQYALCKDQRYAGSGRCEKDTTLDITQFFSPENNTCVSLYEVPREHGGYLLDCTGREDGAHPDDGTQRPNLYFTCQGGQRTGIQLCPDGQVYGDLTTPCVPALVVLPPS